MMTPWWRRLGRNRLWDVGAAVIAIACAVKVAMILPYAATEFDFAHYYVSSRLWIDGVNPYALPLASGYQHYGFPVHPEIPVATNPPALLWVFAPLALLSPHLAFACWVGIEVASLCAILALTRKLLGERLSTRGFYFVCMLSVASAAVYFHFRSSQVQLSLAALLLAGLHWHKQGKHTAACLAVAAAGMLKLYPFVLLPWFLWRGAGTLGKRCGRAILVAGTIGLAVVVTRPVLWGDFFSHSVPVLRLWAMHHFFNYTVSSLVTHVGYAVNGFHLSPETAHLWWIAGMASGLALIVLTYGWCLVKADDEEAGFCLLSCAMLAGNATTWEHYFVFLIFPMAVMAVRVKSNPTARGMVFGGILLLALNTLNSSDTQFLDRHLYLKILWNYIPLYGVMALGFFFATQMSAHTGLAPATATAAGTTDTASNTQPRR